MVKYCYLCGRKQQKGKQPSMHRFPKNQQLRSLWIEACGLMETDDVSTIKICSTHFRPKDFLEPMSRILGSHLRLKAGVVPSIRVPKVIPLLNWADNFQSNINEEGIIEEIVETSCPDADKHEEILLIPSNCDCVASQDYFKTETVDNYSPESGIETYQEVEDYIPIVHQDHLYTSPFKRKSTPTQCSRQHKIPLQHKLGTPKQQIHTCSRKRRFVEPRYVSEVELSDLTENPKVADRTLKFIKTTNATQKLKIKMLQGKVTRLQKRIQRLKGIISQEQRQKDEIKIIDALPETIKNILLRKATNGRYSDELKTFAITLYAYSPKGYNYVRKFWGKLLPHPTTITEWQRDNNKVKEASDGVNLEVLKNEFIVDEITEEEQMILGYPNDGLEVICGENEFQPESGSLTLYAIDQQD